jgi:hypothetical protein
MTRVFTNAFLPAGKESIFGYAEPLLDDLAQLQVRAVWPSTLPTLPTSLMREN